MTEILRKYGAAATILFELIDRGGTNFEATPVSFAAGDSKISKDEAAFGNTTNNPAHEGNGIYSLALTATEMQAARISVTIIDQTATKEWEDQRIIISTYGNASAQHAFDLDVATQDVNVASADAASIASGVIAFAELNNIADAMLKRDFSSVSGEAARSALNALRFLRNKWSISGSTLTVTEEDDSTSAWTGTVTTAAGNPVTGVDPS